MGCSSSGNVGVNGEDNFTQENKGDELTKLNDLINEFKKGINEYEKYKKDYEKILGLQQRVEKEINTYFKVKGTRNIKLEKGKIAFYPIIFTKISKIEEKLQINPNNINIIIPK